MFRRRFSPPALLVLLASIIGAGPAPAADDEPIDPGATYLALFSQGDDRFAWRPFCPAPTPPARFAWDATQEDSPPCPGGVVAAVRQTVLDTPAGKVSFRRIDMTGAAPGPMLPLGTVYRHRAKELHPLQKVGLLANPCAPVFVVDGQLSSGRCLLRYEENDTYRAFQVGGGLGVLAPVMLHAGAVNLHDADPGRIDALRAAILSVQPELAPRLVHEIAAPLHLDCEGGPEEVVCAVSAP